MLRQYMFTPPCPSETTVTCQLLLKVFIPLDENLNIIRYNKPFFLKLDDFQEHEVAEAMQHAN